MFVRGNVWCKNLSINNFKKGNTKVIMLSLENAASGTNLQEATHIVFMEPIYQTFETMKATYNLHPSIPISEGYVYLMEYIEEPTFYEVLKNREKDKIDLYSYWCDPNGGDHNYLQSILFALRDTLHNNNITHNDLQFKNIMVKFNDQGYIDTMILIDFGQAQPGNDEVGHDYEYNVFDIDGQLDKCRRRFPDKYNQDVKSSHKIKKSKKKVRKRSRSRKSKKKSLKI